MENTQLLESVSKIIREVVNNASLKIESGSLLIGDLGLESIDFLDVSSELENLVGKEVDFKALAESVSKKSGKPADIKAVSVKDLVEYLS
jgi:acyl carrier protein